MYVRLLNLITLRLRLGLLILCDFVKTGLQQGQFEFQTLNFL